MNYSFLADNVWGSSGRQSGPVYEMKIIQNINTN